MAEWLELLPLQEAPLTLIFWGSLLVGLFLALVSFLFGEVIGLGLDAAEAGPISGPTIAIFMAFFGLGGLVLRDLAGFGPTGSILGTLFISVVGTLAIYYGGFRLILTQQGGTNFDPNTVANIAAKVITGIPAEGMGEISFDTNAGRISGPARSTSGQAISNGNLVNIDRYAAGIYLVSPLMGGNPQPENPTKENAST